MNIDTKNFEMFTKEGNNAIRTRLQKLLHNIETKSGHLITPLVIKQEYEKILEAVAVKHEEVYDTEPSYHIRFLIKKCLNENFYDETKFLND